MKLYGNAVSKGVAVGKVFVYRPMEFALEEKYCASEEGESQWKKYLSSKDQAAAELRRLVSVLEEKDAEKAKILMAHEEILNDVTVNEEIESSIRLQCLEGSWAIQKIYSQYEELLASSDVPLMRERKDDLKDVKERLLRSWFGVKQQDLSCLEEPVIIASYDLLPSDTATLDRKNVLAVLTEIGGTTSHTAIIAKSYGIPAVLGISNLLAAVASGDTVGVDAENGVVITNPSPALIKELTFQREEWLQRKNEVKKFLHSKAITADGVRIDIGLNIEDPDRTELQTADFIDFVGLFRTEFIYMEHAHLPEEEEQYQIYKRVLENFKDRPVTLRTLDIGGDKTAECLPLPREDNPFLGNRALRFCFSQPQIFRTQLRAALRASVYGELWLMLPMIGSIDDIRKAKAFIEEVKQELYKEGYAIAENLKVGIMVEIPSIALVADLAAAEVDFASIGTNDLCQYLMAADRQNPAVSAYYQTCHPAAFRIIAEAVKAFQSAGKPISVCGEMGGDPLLAKVLVGLGLRKLSMNPSSIASVKEALSRFTISQAECLAERVKNLHTSDEILRCLKEER